MDGRARWPVSLSIKHLLKRRRLYATDACESVYGYSACKVRRHTSGSGGKVGTEGLHAAHKVHQEQLVGVSADSYEVEEVLELVLSDLVVKLHYRGIQEVSWHSDLRRLAHVLLQDLLPGFLVGPLSAKRVFDLLGKLHK